MSNQPVNVHIQTGAGEIIRIVGTLLAFGGVGVLAWVIAQQGYAEKVATVLAAAVAFIAMRLWSRGILAIPTASGPAAGTDQDVDFLRQVGRSATAVSGGYLARASVPMLCLIGLGYGLAFLALRTAITMALQVFQNMYIAGGAALLLGSLVVAPSLFPNLVSSLKSKGVVRPEGTAGATPVAPAAQPPATPVAPAPAAPIAAPVQPGSLPGGPSVDADLMPAHHYQPTPAAAPKKVVRRVKKVSE